MGMGGIHDANVSAAVSQVAAAGTTGLLRALERVPVASVAVDPAWAIVFASSEAERLLGHPRGALAGVRFEAVVSERSRARLAALRAKAKAGVAPGSLAIDRCLCRGGVELPVAVDVAPIEGAGKARAIVVLQLQRRTGRDLQTLARVLHQQATRLEPGVVRRGFEECGSRIGAVGLAHELLCESMDPTRLAVGEYLRSICRRLVEARGESVRIGCAIDGSAIRLDVDAAVSCGLAVNELVSNALDHAFPGARRGRIHVSLRRTADESLALTVADDGVGFPGEVRVPAARTLGLKTVWALANRLRGALLVSSSREGTTFVIRFSSSRLG